MIEKDDDFLNDPDFIWACLESRDRDFIASNYGTVMAGLSKGLRGAITAGPGKVLYVADFANIESRVLSWLAQDNEALDRFRNKIDPYNDMASFVYGRPINRKVDKTEGQIGKVAVLGLGFQMGAAKFADTVLDWTGVVIPVDLYCAKCHDGRRRHDQDQHHDFVFRAGETADIMTAVRVVEAYRTKNWKVRDMWKDQEQAAIRAVQTGRPQRCGRVTWIPTDQFLYCELPSGRRLSYPEPEIAYRETPWGKKQPQLTHMGVNPFNRQWQRQTTYGGLLVENITQAVSRDLLADALLRLESTEYKPVLSVHDEIATERAEGTGSLDEFTRVMTQLPQWAQGCPVEAESWVGRRYRK